MKSEESWAIYWSLLSIFSECRLFFNKVFGWQWSGVYDFLFHKRCMDKGSVPTKYWSIPQHQCTFFPELLPAQTLAKIYNTSFCSSPNLSLTDVESCSLRSVHSTFIFSRYYSQSSILCCTSPSAFSFLKYFINDKDIYICFPNVILKISLYFSLR